MKAWVELNLDELQQRHGQLPPPEDPTYKSAFVELAYLRLLEREAALARMTAESYPFIGNLRVMPSDGNGRKVWVLVDLDELREALNVAEPKGGEYERFLLHLGTFRFLDEAVFALHTPGVLRGHQRLDDAIALADGRRDLMRDAGTAGAHPPVAPVNPEPEAPRYPPAEDVPELVEA